MKKLLSLLFLLFSSNFLCAMEPKCTIALFNASEETIPLKISSPNEAFLPINGIAHEPKVLDIVRLTTMQPLSRSSITFTPKALSALFVGAQAIHFSLLHSGRFIVWIEGEPAEAKLVAQTRRDLENPPAPGQHSTQEAQSYNFLFHDDRKQPLLTFEEMVEQCEASLEKKEG